MWTLPLRGHGSLGDLADTVETDTTTLKAEISLTEPETQVQKAVVFPGTTQILPSMTWYLVYSTKRVMWSKTFALCLLGITPAFTRRRDQQESQKKTYGQGRRDNLKILALFERRMDMVLKRWQASSWANPSANRHFLSLTIWGIENFSKRHRRLRVKLYGRRARYVLQ